MGRRDFESKKVRDLPRRRGGTEESKREKSLGFGYVPPEQAVPGSVIDIGLLDARCRATVLAEPTYDPANERLAS